jgi:hypothetical protein
MFSRLWNHSDDTNSDDTSDACDAEDAQDAQDAQDDNEREDPNDAEKEDLHRLQQIISVFQKLMVSAAGVVDIAVDAYNSYTQAHYDKEPYHTSALSGIAWVNELLAGHPERVRCELGVHRHVFIILLNVLRESGIDDSKNVTLEEQLAIFLYACVTGLSVRHLGERFQRSNDTISKYVLP